ncbi:heparinase II/III family protein [Bacteroidota bacterium]
MTIFLLGMLSSHFVTGQKLNETTLPQHPRLIFHKEDEAGLRKSLSENNYIAELHRVIIEASDAMLESETVFYEKTGKRLLSVSRACLKRVAYLSYSYRLTKDIKYLKRAEKEMLAAAGFKDWNPDHFLDVAEMTTALAIGYDWLYDDLDDNSKTIIIDAIIEKGLIPSKNSLYNQWLVRVNNWNQVCNGGLSLGAMAIYESEPDLAQEIIDRARESIKIPQHEYEPDGAYPEGSTYWAYGTMYNVLFIDAYRECFALDENFKLGEGFIKSGHFFLHVFGPAGSFNFSDCRIDSEYTPAIFWYSGELKDNTILYNQNKLLNELVETKNFRSGKTSYDRFLPMIPIWASGFESLDINEPEEKSWTGRGTNPVSFHRSSWDDNGIFIGIKGGSPSLSHAHMDIGSFVMDAEGIRWAMDLGKHDYYKLESRGMDIWNREQDSERWSVFRYGSYSHNTLTVNNELQRAEGQGTIIRSSDHENFRNTVLDISGVYEGQLESALRGIAIADGKYVILRDEILNTEKSGTVRWAMLTHDNIEIIEDKLAIIRKDGKELRFFVIEPQKVKIQTYSTKPENEFEDENPGTRMIGFEVELQPEEEQTLMVVLIPGDNDLPDEINSVELSDW